MIEIELKYGVSSAIQASIRQKLQDLPSHKLKKNIDFYYDTQQFDLFRQAVFVRLRNSSQLEFKFNEQAQKAHIQSIERTFPTSNLLDGNIAQTMNALFRRFLPHWHDAHNVKAALDENGLIELARIRKQREAYRDNDIVIALDTVEGLGTFLEIETQCEECTDTSKALTRLQAYASSLDASLYKYVAVGYVELWLREHNPLAYELGIYKVE